VRLRDIATNENKAQCEADEAAEYTDVKHIQNNVEMINTMTTAWQKA
jgi:hypothetical protein